MPLINDASEIGLVIGTFSAVPYIHLHLESRRLYYPNIPCLVHDDYSNKKDELQSLCYKYKADFRHGIFRFTHTVGDMSAFLQGLLWAKKLGLKVLVKMSRRFIPTTNWTNELIDLKNKTDGLTFSGYCNHYDFGFRTECLALDVNVWTKQDILSKLSYFVDNNKPSFVEGELHNIARYINQLYTDDICNKYIKDTNLGPGRDGYIFWPFVGTSRNIKIDSHLWHDSHTPRNYWQLSTSYGLNYPYYDFIDPNQGQGIG